MKFLGIDHLAIAADNVEELVNWYCRVMGFKVYVINSKPVFLLISPNGVMLEIMPKDIFSERQSRKFDSPGFSHLALGVADINSAIDHLKQHEVKWAGNLADATGGGSVISFYDLEGNLLQIVQR